MKKIKYLLLLLVLSLYLCGYACFPGEEFTYSDEYLAEIDASDTYARYQFYGKRGKLVEQFVLNYSVIDDYVYLLGLYGTDNSISNDNYPFVKYMTLESLPEEVYFTKYNMDTGDYVQSNRLRDFSEEDVNIFLGFFSEKTLPERNMDE